MQPLKNRDEVRVAHLIDYLSPTSSPWFLVLINKLKAKNYIFPFVVDHYKQIDKGNFVIIKITEQRLQKFKSIKRGLNKINTFLRYYTLKKAIKKNNIQIIHAHFAHVGWEAIRLKKALKIPLIVSFYGYDYQSVPHKYPIWKARYKTLFNSADIIICEGNNGKIILEGMGCNPLKIKVAKLGIEINKIEFTNRIKIPESLKLVQIANLVEKKGHKYTLMAFVLALKSNPNMHLTLIGEGDKNCKNEILEIIKNYNITDKVSLINRIDYSKLHNVLNDYDVFIHPSCYSKDMDCEGGAPIVLLDAQATGLPIISTYHCDIPDEVSDNVSGLLAEEKNIEQLASHLSKFYQMKQDEYSTFSYKARKQVVEKYDINKNADEFITIYEQTLIKGL